MKIAKKIKKNLNVVRAIFDMRLFLAANGEMSDWSIPILMPA